MPDIRDFDGIRLGLPAAESLIDASLGLADKFHAGTGGGLLNVAVSTSSRLALVAALAASNAMLTFGSATCTLSAPPEDIGAFTGQDGNLVLRCGHNPPHEWDYGTGARRIIAVP